MNAQQARERIGAALDAIDAAHDVLRQTSSDVVGNVFRVEVAARLETQHRTSRGLMYRIFGEIADPPDGPGPVVLVRDMLWARLRIKPKEMTRRFKLAARIRPRRSLTGPLLQPELPTLAAAVSAGAVGEDHIRAVCAAVDTLPASVSPADAADAERRLVQHSAKVDAAVVTQLGRRIADYLNPDGLFNDVDRARRRGLHLGPQGPDGMSRLSGLLDPEARAYFEAVEAAVRPGRHQPDSAGGEPGARDERTPAQRRHDALKFGLESAVGSGQLGIHRGHPVTVIATTTLAELDQAARAAVDSSVPMPTPALTGGGSRLPMPDLLRMAAKAIHYLAVFDEHNGARCIWAARNASRPRINGSSATRATADAPTPIASNPGITARFTSMRPNGRTGAGPTRTSCFSPAAPTTARRAGANGEPRSPAMGDSAGPTAPDRPGINHAHHPDELLRGDPDPPEGD